MIEENIDPEKAYIGREYETTLIQGKPVYKLKNALQLNVKIAFHTFICGKTGKGKSYLTRVFIEEIIDLLTNFCGTVIIDPKGDFVSLKYRNTKREELVGWDDVKPKGFPQVKIYVPEGDKKQFKPEMYDGTFSLRPEQISIDMFCFAFDIDYLDPMANAYKHIFALIEKSETRDYSLQNIRSIIADMRSDKEFKETTLDALIIRIRTLVESGIISDHGIELRELIVPGTVVLLDLSMTNFYAAKVIVNFFAENILDERKKIKRLIDYNQTTTLEQLAIPKYFPPVQLILDEAHLFFKNRGTDNETLQRYIKKGRSLGCMFTGISQSPDLDKTLFKQLNYLFVGKLTYEDDLTDVRKIFPAVSNEQKEGLKEEIRKLQVGCFYFFNSEDDTVKRIKVRPSKTLHLAGTQLVDERNFILANKKMDPKIEISTQLAEVEAEIEQLTAIPQNTKEIPFFKPFSKFKSASFSSIRKYDQYQVGQILRPKVSGIGLLGPIRVVFKHSKKLAELPDEFLCHDTDTKTRAEAIQVLNSCYQEKPILPDDFVFIFNFEWIKEKPKEAILEQNEAGMSEIEYNNY